MTTKFKTTAHRKTGWLHSTGRIVKSWPFRLAGTALCVWLLLRHIDVSAAVQVLKEADLHVLALVVAVSSLILVASFIEWAVLIHNAAPNISWPKLFHIFYKSLAAQHLIPTGLGGDALRIYEVSKITGDPAAASAPGVVSKLSSSTALMIWALLGSLQLKGEIAPWAISVSGAAVFGMAMLWLLTVLPGGTALALVKWTKRFNVAVARAIARFAAELKEIGANPQTLALCLSASLLGWGIQFATLSMIALALHIDAGWHLFAVAFPCSLIATMAPFALNGYGLREGILVGILVSNGIDKNHAAALALLADLQMVPFVLLSTMLWLDVHNRDQMSRASDTGTGVTESRVGSGRHTL